MLFGLNTVVFLIFFEVFYVKHVLPPPEIDYVSFCLISYKYVPQRFLCAVLNK